jgi:hypothetical protein
MKWVEAIKKWNESRGFVKGSKDVKWSIPKKGTTEHGEVMKLMKGEGMPKGNKRAGYVGLIVAKSQGKQPSDYENGTPKKSVPTKIALSKMKHFSENLLTNHGSETEKKKYGKEFKTARFQTESVEGKPNTKRVKGVKKPTTVAYNKRQVREREEETDGKQLTLTGEIAQPKKAEAKSQPKTRPSKEVQRSLMDLFKVKQ